MSSKIILFFYFIIFLALMIPLYLSTPFYISYDMDHITFLDLLHVNSGQLPLHLHHPGAGMLFILYWMERVFDLFSLSPIISFINLENSLEPILVVANKVTFLRWCNHIILISIKACMLYILYKIHKGKLFLFSGIIFCVSCQFFWYYNPFKLRTETFSIFFFFIALSIIAYDFFKKEKKNH